MNSAILSRESRFSWQKVHEQRILTALSFLPMKYRQEENHDPFMKVKHLLSSPFIYAQIIPLVFFDVFLEIYHHVCFPIYHIPFVRRGDYIKMDRHKLSYLSWYEKINCAYCGYANGWMRYAGAIAGASEKYWCGITQQKYAGVKMPESQKDYLPYGDEKAFEEFVNK